MGAQGEAMRKLLAVVCFLGCCVLASGQAYTTITAANVTVDNGSGTAINPPAGSSLCFLGVNSVGAAITYTPSGGSPVSGTVCQTLTSGGALTGTLQVANPATATPLGLYYTITVINGSTTYLTIPTTTVSGTTWSFDAFSLPGTKTALGIGNAHLACASGAQWTSTTLPPGQNAETCNPGGQWKGYPPNNYCPHGQAFMVPQGGGTPFCQSPTYTGNGAPSGICVNGSSYFQNDATSGQNLWNCINATWVQQTGSGASPGGSHFNLQFNNGSGGFGGDSGIITDGSGNLTAKYRGGIPQADAFAGADFCAQLRTAALWAVANNVNLVDATHFPKTVACASDPLTALDGTGNGGSVPLTIMMPASWISSTVAWNINNSNVQLIGKGSGETIIEYTGGTVVPEVLTVGGSVTNAWYADSVQIKDLSIIGHSANATDGLALKDAGNGKLDNIYTWGVTGCGIHTYNSVTETFVKPTTSSAQASHIGYLTGYSVPAHGLCFDQTTSGSLTTDGTVTDADTTGVSGAGWDLIAAQGMTFTGGTSESNGAGILIASTSYFNTFINSDLESNTANANGVDVSDSGYSNSFHNLIAISTCSGCNSVLLDGGSNVPPIFHLGKVTSIGGTQGIQEVADPNLGATFIGYGSVGSLGAEYPGTSSASPFMIYAPNLANGSILGMCIGVDRYCIASYNEGLINFNYYNSGNVGNFLYLRVNGGPSLRWDGNGNLYAGSGASGNLGGSGGWWKSILMGSGNTYTTTINPPASPAASNTITLPTQSGTLALSLSGTTGSIGGSALLVNACTSGTVSITGAATGMLVVADPSSDPNSGTTQDYDWYARVTSAGTVTVYECAIVAGTPAATTFNVRVIQ